MKALSEPSLPGQMLYHTSLYTPGWAAASPTQPPYLLPNSKPFSQLFHVPVGLARVRPSQSPSSVSTDPSVSSPGQPVLLRGRWSLRFCSPTSCPHDLRMWEERTPPSCAVCLLKPSLSPRQDSAGPDGLSVTTLCMALCAGWSSYPTCQPPEPSEP